MKLILFAPLLFASAAAGAQSVRLVPDMAVAESEYRDAQEAWLRSDPDLERDLYKRGREEMRTRIRRAATLRDDAMAKKEVYLGLLASHFDTIRTRLASPESGGIPVEQIKRDLEREQSRLLAEEERLESLMRDLPEGDEYALVRRAMEAEKNDLITLQNSVALRMRSLDRIGASQQAGSEPAAAESLAEKLDEIGRIWAGEHARATRERAAWAHYYADLETSLSAGATAPQAPDTARRVSGGRNGSDAAVQPGLGTGNRIPRQKTMDGAWTYESQPGAWTGFGEPEAVRLELKRSGNDIEGTYVARLPGLHDIRQVSLVLRGRLVSDREATVQWVSQRPAAHGEMELKLGSDGRLLVQRVSSDDSYIPTGMEVLLPR